MIPELRNKFNRDFTEEKYKNLIKSLYIETGTEIDFHICETPVFIDEELMQKMLKSSEEIVAQLQTPEYMKASDGAIPAEFSTPGEGAHPHFVQIDFAVTRDGKGVLTPKLIELQGCASLYAFQLKLAEHYIKGYGLEQFDYLLSGFSDTDYLNLMRKVLLGKHGPEEVVLMEIDPLHQKTLPDFIATEKLLGIPFVCVTDIFKRGNRLFYKKNGKEIGIRRIYNRVIIDEFIRRGIRAGFDFRDDLDVEWAGHPNWFFRMSKYSLPFLDHPTVPRSYVLGYLDSYPDDLENFVLKPLFSFAGSGVRVDLSRKDLDSVPENDRSVFLLQEKVSYEPVVQTPDEPAKVEVRIMHLWPEDAENPTPVNTLVRLSKGAMMGVDFNKDKKWVGSSTGLFPHGESE